MEYDLDNEETRDLLDGLHAWDEGCVDSGIHDEMRRQGLKEYFQRVVDPDPERHPEDRCRLISAELDKKLCRYIRECMLSEESLKQGYGLEDLFSRLRWLEEEMGLPLRGIFLLIKKR